MDDLDVSRARQKEAFARIFQSVWYRLVLLFSAAYQTVFWFVLGPSNPLYALGMVGTTFALGPALAGPVERRLPRHWFRVPQRERIIQAFLGVNFFAWLLEKSGWNHVVAKPMRGFSGQRADLLCLEQGLRSNVAAHGTCFVIHVLLAFLALFGKHPISGALWMLLPGVVVHLYPVMLQRVLMLRLQPMLDKLGARRPISS
jgi:hypothetical protein